MTMPTLTGLRLHFRTPGCAPAGTLRHALGDCALGALLVARSGRGIAAVLLHDCPAALPGQLAQIFPAADPEPDTRGMLADLDHVATLIDTGVCNATLDLDLGGTPLQRRVWQVLCGIPAGQTRTYTEIAREVGVPQAVRAVANACAANVLAVVIPCHRALRRDGLLTGYRWGIGRKRALLERERLYLER